MADRRDADRPSDRQRALGDNERVTVERLRRDARRPGGELLDEAIRLSSFAVELRAAGRSARR